MAQARPKKFKKSKEETPKKKKSTAKKVVRKKKAPVEESVNTVPSSPTPDTTQAMNADTFASKSNSVSQSLPETPPVTQPIENTVNTETVTEVPEQVPAGITSPVQEEGVTEPAQTEPTVQPVANNPQEAVMPTPPVMPQSDQTAATTASESTSSVPPFTPKFDKDSTLQPPSNKRKTFLIVSIFIILLVLIIGVIFVYFYVSKKSKIPFLNNNVTHMQHVSITPKVLTPTPTPTVDKIAYSIEVLNGSGKSGQAGNAQAVLEKDNFTVGNIGNADVYTYKQTVIKAKKSVDSAYLHSLKKTLSSKYDVATDTATLQDSTKYDVEVIVGSDPAPEQ